MAGTHAGARPAGWRLMVMLLAIAVLPMGCNLYRPEERPAAAGTVPATYSLYVPGQVGTNHWWTTFGDAELNDLVDQALADGFSIRKAWARLRQARALAVKAGAMRYPDLSVDAGAAATRQRTNAGRTFGSETYTLGLASGYEVDLWGRVRSDQQAALLAAAASEQDLHAAAMTVAASVVLRWADIISERMQHRLLNEQLKANETVLELINLRFRKGMVSALDVYQQQQVVEGVKAQIPLVQSRQQQLHHELAVLLGKPPRSVLVLNRKRLPDVGQLPPTGLPADLLAARPDVRAAGMRLKSADWQVAAARADRLPAIRLSASAGFDADRAPELFDGWLLRLAGNLTAPIFDAGLRAAEVDRARAVADEALWNYRDTVLAAIREVDDALVSEAQRRRHIQALRQQIDTARKGLAQAGQRYRKGLTDYLPVLTQLVSVQGLERDLIRQRNALLADRIGLYRALGGTWTSDLTAGGADAPPDTQLTEKTTYDGS